MAILSCGNFSGDDCVIIHQDAGPIHAISYDGLHTEFVAVDNVPFINLNQSTAIRRESP